MKRFYLKSSIALAVIVAAVCIGLRLVQPAKSISKSKSELTNMLSDGNVHIAPELLDMTEYDVCDCSMLSSIDTMSLAKQFLGRSPRKVTDTEYTSSEGSFTVTESHFTYTPSAPKFSADTKLVSVSNAVPIALRLCDEYGIDYADGKTELSSSKDGVYVSIMKTLNGLPMFNNALVMDLRTDGLYSVSGVDFRIISGTEQFRPAKSISDALREFMRECTDKKRETILTDIQLGYLLDTPDVKETSLRPVWRIIVENSAVYYIDA